MLLTLWFDIAMNYAAFMQVCETFEELQRVYHYDLFILDPSVFK